MKRRDLNNTDQLVYEFIRDHPGSNQSEVYLQMLKHGYRSREHIRTIILRLQALKLIRDDRSGNAASLFAT